MLDSSMPPAPAMAERTVASQRSTVQLLLER